MTTCFTEVLFPKMRAHEILLFVFLTWMSITIRASDVSEFPLPERFKTRPSIFNQLDDILSEYNPLNLGVGYPDYPPAKKTQNALANAATSQNSALSQYSPDNGLPRLLKALSKFYSRLLNRTLDPDDNFIVTTGATEALFLTFLTHTFSGQEWIVFEPFYDIYLPAIKAANGILRPIKLKPKLNNMQNLTSADWTFDREELSSLFNEKTKGILINTPHNPLGKMFTLDELIFIADLAKKWKTLVVVDEVYQFLNFDNNEHIRMSTLPGMFEQTILIGSAGKMFGATGYRIGWAYGAKKLIDNLKPVHSIAVMCAPTPIQEAIAIGIEEEMKDLDKSNSFIEQFKKEAEANIEHLYQILHKAGMSPILPQGGFFMTANWTTMSESIVLESKNNECKDYTFAKWLVKNVNVFGLPMSSFYYDINECSGKDLLRFTIIKGREAYEDAEKRFSKWLSQQQINHCKLSSMK